MKKKIIIKENLDLSNLDKRIQHLSKENILDMINQYYQGFPVSELIRKYRVEISVMKLFELFPKELSKERCVYCDERLERKLKVRTYPFDVEFHCPICNHSDNNHCSCENCEFKLSELKKREEKSKIEMIKSKYSEENNMKVLESELSLQDILYLSAVLKCWLDEDIEFIRPETITEREIIPAPTKEYTFEIVRYLIEEKIIIPHTCNSFTSFIDDKNFPDSYAVDQVFYYINVEPLDGDYNWMIQRLMYPKRELFEADKEFCYESWKRIALFESLEFLNLSMVKVGFYFKPGKKTHNVFERLLQHFSVSQIYGIIFRAVANSSKMYQEGKLSKLHASNTVITLCESFGERAIAGGWQLTKYRRNFKLPESMISKVLYTSILQIGYMGFDEKPTKEFNI